MGNGKIMKFEMKILWPGKVVEFFIYVKHKEKSNFMLKPWKSHGLFIFCQSHWNVVEFLSRVLQHFSTQEAKRVFRSMLQNILHENSIGPHILHFLINNDENLLIGQETLILEKTWKSQEML